MAAEKSAYERILKLLPELGQSDRLSLLAELQRQVESTDVSPLSLDEFERTIDPAFSVCGYRTDLPEDSSQYVRAMRELRGKFRGKGLMEELMAEKKREKRTR